MMARRLRWLRARVARVGRRAVVLAALGGAVAVAAPGGSARAQSGSAAPAGSGSGSAGAPTIIQLPTDIAAPNVSAAAAPTVVALGAPFTVFVQATYGDGVEVNLIEPVDLGAGFEVRRKLSENRKTVDGRTTKEWQLEVIPWEVGDVAMAPIAVTYTAFGKAAQVTSNAVRLKIVGVLGALVDDPKAMRDHAPPARITVRDWFWLWVGGGAMAAGALLGVAVWSARRRRRRTVRLVGGAVAAPRRIDMTSTRALERLLAIEQAGTLAAAATRREGYAEMVEVVREYIGARYHVTLGDLTSRELLRRLAGVAPADDIARIEAWLEACDLVKYGGLHTTAEAAQATLVDARGLVIATSTPVAVTAPADSRAEVA